MTLPLSLSAQKVQAALLAKGVPLTVIELPQSTRTSAEAAQAVGCAIGQIAKSIILRAAQSDQPVLVLTSGANRVDEVAVAEWVGEPLKKADADYVRTRTGFVIGGVPPVGHAEPPLTFIDEDLLQYAEIWAAAGTPNALFKLTPAELLAVTAGRVARVAAR
jgi:prolyl-tRNA editing enzyme YbaK/EbsC (Cys-tRNA(Pro) deacylase)